MIDLNEIMRGVQVIARRNGVRIQARRRWVVRFAVASVLFRLAARVAGYDYEEGEWEEE